eukprot:TRINITY_DN9266_c0_g2_i2.p1 TRINITY_DN9266_c0_g2~~TRINITY_DN9266_c0_g2_i2.p1  ORF type:complete len:317 (+),score=33.12 TRINITY_DN9266_c0_g2_i2:184-1134(+)
MMIRPGMRHLSIFSHPTPCPSLALSSSTSRLYLANFLHHIITVIDSTTGACLTQYGTPDQSGQSSLGQLPQFNSPRAVALDEIRNRLFVTDQANHCVVVIQLDTGLVEAIWGRGPGSEQSQFYFPCALAYCASTDQLYVADCFNDCVKVVRGSDGQCVQVLAIGRERFNCGTSMMNHPEGVAVDTDQVYVADSGNGRVLVFDKQSGIWKFQLGQNGPGQEQTHRQGQGESSRGSENQPSYLLSVCVDSEKGLVYVVNCDSRCVSVYRSSDGSYVRHFQVWHQDNTEADPVAVMWDSVSSSLYITLDHSTTICVYEC